jgi:hypothetical protein
VLAALLAVGCADRHSLETFTMPPGQSPAGGLVAGVLQGHEACVQLVVPGRPPRALLWATDYTVTFRPLRIYDAAGKLVAIGGQPVWLGVEGGKTTSNPGCGTTNAYWVFSITTKDPITDTP